MTEVLLTPLRDADSPTLFRWINDRALVLLNAPFRPVSPEGHAAWFSAVRRDPTRAIFVIREASDGPALGTCQLHDIHPVHLTAELQIRIGDSTARGRGLGTSAVRQLLACAFRERGLHRVMVHVFTTNAPAIRLYERTGFRHEGVLRQAAVIDERRVDIAVMGILASEFHG
jgi:RimJ/RimL family protein N-acetyltransferase